jgi:hypothetical protein
MAHDTPSHLLRSLDKATAIALAEEAAALSGGETPDPYAIPVRGGHLEQPGAMQQPTPPSVLLDALNVADMRISAQVAMLQAWLRAHPDLLRLLDAGMHAELKEMERRTNRKSLSYNAVFTALGAIFGFLLPHVVSALPVIGHLGGH